MFRKDSHCLLFIVTPMKHSAKTPASRMQVDSNRHLAHVQESRGFGCPVSEYAAHDESHSLLRAEKVAYGCELGGQIEASAWELPAGASGSVI